MNKKKIYIFGATGYIGSALCERLSEIDAEALSFGRHKESDIYFDLKNPDLALLDIIGENDVCVFLAAVSSPEYCSKFYKDAQFINVESTLGVISFLLKTGAHVLFASSDVVYGGSGNIVDESNPVSPDFEYARMKAIVEAKFSSSPRFHVMRLSYVWSVNDKFTKFLLESAKSGLIVDVFNPFVRSIISLDDVIDFILIFIERPFDVPDIVNLAGPDYVSRINLVEIINRHIDLNYRVIELESDADFFKFRAQRILMNSMYLSNLLGREPVRIEECMAEKLALVAERLK